MKKLLIIISTIIAAVTFALFAACGGCTKGDGGTESEKFDFNLLMSSVIIDKGDSERIKTNYYGEYETTFVSSDESVITVTRDGLVTGVNAGKATVSVTINGVTKICNVAVNDSAAPTIRFLNIKNKAGENVIVGNVYTVESALIFKGKEVTEGATYAYSVGENGVLSNVGKKIKAEKTGQGEFKITARYLDYEVTETVVFNVIENVSVVVPVNAIELDTKNETSFDFSGKNEVYAVKDGVRLSKTFVWESSDVAVAEVSESGTVTATGKGEAVISVSCQENGITYNAYVSVTVKTPRLATPENLRVVNAENKTDNLDNEKYFKWDGVADAKYYTVTVEDKEYTVQAGEEYRIDITENVGYTYLTVTAHTDDGLTEDSEEASINEYFKTASLEKKAIAKNYYLDADKITRQDYPSANVYYAECKTMDYTLLGYSFMKIYYTKNAQSFSSLWYLNGSLIDYTEDLAKYQSKIVSMWVYANEQITISDLVYIPDTRKTVQSYVIPAETWTKVSFSISRTNYKFIVSIITTGNFYYTDLRVSDVDYADADYSKCGFHPGYGIEQELGEFAVKYSDVNSINELAYTAIAKIDGLYGKLSETRKTEISATENYKKFVGVKEFFAKKYVIVDDMTDSSELLLYDTVKDTGFRVSDNYTHPHLLSLSNGLFDETYGTYLNFNLHKKDGSWTVGTIEYAHAAIGYNLDSKSALLDDCGFVCFYVYNGGVKDKYILANFGGKVTDRYDGITLKSGEWTKVTVPTQDFLSGNSFGIAFACDGAGDYDFKISTIFGIKDGDAYYDNDIFPAESR